MAVKHSTPSDGTFSGSGATAWDANHTVDDNTLLAAKLSAAATQRAFGRNTAGAGAGEEVTLSQILDWIGSAAQGDILYRDAGGWARLAAGASGNFLKTLGAAANPVWASAPGSGGVADVQVFTANGTWTKPATVNFVAVYIEGTGSGGGSGRRGAAGTARFGGGGGCGGAFCSRVFQAADLAATESVVIGAAGTGGAAVTVDNTDGSNGSRGGDCTFSSGSKLVQASPGNQGNGGTAASGGAGSNASSVGTLAPGAGGSSALAGGNNGVGVTIGQVGQAGTGGGGASGITAGDAPSVGGTGGILTGTATGSFLSGGTNGNPAANGNASTAIGCGTGGGGGNSSIVAAAGNGGTGGGFGGGGGGGGASLNGNNSGAGGNGGPGRVTVISW